MNNKITINVQAILNSADNSITDPEIIRQIALHSIQFNNDISHKLFKKVKNEFAITGLYPRVIEKLDINP